MIGLKHRITKALPVLAAALMLVCAGNSFASTRAAPPKIPLILAAAKTGALPNHAAAFAKEQAMTPAERIGRWSPFISEASRRFGIAETWIKAVMRMESGGRTLSDATKKITSKAGAMGVMQMMPATYRDMREAHNLGADPYDPHDNVLAGAAYLSWLYGKYGYPKMFAAYNAGPETLETRRALPEETRAYVGGLAKLLGFKSEFAPAEPAAPQTKIATLTRPDGSPVSIDGATVNSIRAALPNEFVPGVQTVVAIGEKRQGVKEDVAQVAGLLGRQDAIYKPHAVAVSS